MEKKRSKLGVYGCSAVCVMIPLLLMVAAIVRNEENYAEILFPRVTGLAIGVGLFIAFCLWLKHIRRYLLYISAALVFFCAVVVLARFEPAIAAVPSLLIIGMILFLTWSHKWNGVREKKIGLYLLLGSYVLLFAVSVVMQSLAASAAVAVSFFTVEILAFKRFYIGNITIGGDANGDVDRFTFNLLAITGSFWAIARFYLYDLDWYKLSFGRDLIVVLAMQAVFVAAVVVSIRRKCSLAYYLPIAATILLTVEVLAAVCSRCGIMVPGYFGCPFYSPQLSLNIPSWFLLCCIVYPRGRLPGESPAYETCSTETQKILRRYEEPEYVSMVGLEILGEKEREKRIRDLIAYHLEDKDAADPCAEEIAARFFGEDTVYCFQIVGTFAGVVYAFEDHAILPVGSKVCGVYIYRKELAEWERDRITDAFGRGLKREEDKESIYVLPVGEYQEELYTVLFFFAPREDQTFRWIQLD